ncbi:hypothetical protein ACFL51_00120 [Myxococcota bacterium]
MEIYNGPIGYLTPRMSSRHSADVTSMITAGITPNVFAVVKPGEKHGQQLVRAEVWLPER